MGTGTKIFIFFIFVIVAIVFLIVFALSSVYKTGSEISDQFGASLEDIFGSFSGDSWNSGS